MPKVSRQTAAKGGLMTAILGMIGNVVGIGIFFKNGTVFRLNNNNAIGVIVAWAISTLIVLCMAISFAEIASGKTKNGKAGIGPWAETFCGHKFGRYSRLGYNLIFWPINTFAVMFFAGEALLNIIAPVKGWDSISHYDYGRGTTAYIFMIGAALFVMFMIVNYFKFKSMAKVGKGISFVKFAPIAMVVFIGIICGAINGQGLWTNPANTTVLVDLTNQANSSGGFDFFLVIACVPAILFSFEGYVAIDSFKNDLSNPEKQIPLGVVLGVVVIAVLYFAVTIGCITTGTGDVYKLMAYLFGINPDTQLPGKFYNEAAFKALTMIISIFIFICLIGCVNGMARGGITSYQEICKDGTLFKGRDLYNKKPGNEYFAGLVSFFIMVGFWWVILFIPSVIWNTDAIADGSSTSMIVCLYVIYGGIVLCAFANRFNKKVSVNKVGLFPVAAIIGLIGCLLVIGYVAFIQFTVAPITNGLSSYDGVPAKDAFEKFRLIKSGWGMFASDTATSHKMTNLEIMCFFWGMTIIAGLSPVFNDLFIKWWDKKNKNPLMWQKAVVGKKVA